VLLVTKRAPGAVGTVANRRAALLGAIGEFERCTMLQRQREVTAGAKSENRARRPFGKVCADRGLGKSCGAEASK
jgi:hypothetical protein